MLSVSMGGTNFGRAGTFMNIIVICMAVICTIQEVGAGSPSCRLDAFLGIRGGLVKAADDNKGGGDYYEQFTLDYGSEDRERYAGSLRGFLKSGALSSLPEKDPFKKWLNEHLERGQEELKGRIKPFYAADFGTKKDLDHGENPKIMIVQRMLKSSKDGKDIVSAPGMDIEVREVWQPWLKRKCNFAVRYIIPSRTNIVKILEKDGRFKSQVIAQNLPNGARQLKNKLVFRPRLRERLMGQRDEVLWRDIDGKGLELSNPKYKDAKIENLSAAGSKLGHFKFPKIGVSSLGDAKKKKGSKSNGKVRSSASTPTSVPDGTIALPLQTPKTKRVRKQTTPSKKLRSKAPVKKPSKEAPEPASAIAKGAAEDTAMTMAAGPENRTKAKKEKMTLLMPIFKGESKKKKSDAKASALTATTSD